MRNDNPLGVNPHFETQLEIESNSNNSCKLRVVLK